MVTIKATSCQQFPNERYQKLPKSTKIGQLRSKLPKVAKVCQNLPKIAKISKMYQKLPKDAKTCQKLAKVAKR